MVTPAPLLPWPSESSADDCAVYGQHAFTTYHRAHAEAAMQRLRAAVEALDTIRQSQNELAMTRYAKDALTAIGPLPDLPPQPGEG